MGKKYTVLAGRGELIVLQQDKKLYNPLINAIISGDFNAFSKALIQFRSEWSADKDCHAAVKIKEQFGENFNKLKIRINKGKNYVELTPLQLAVKSGNLQIVQFLLRNTSEPQTLLSETIQVKMHGNDQGVVLGKYVSESTALHIAAAQAPLPVMQLLLDNNTDENIINQANALGYPPLFLAAAAGKLDTVDLLLAKGANRTTRVNNMNFAEYAQRFGENIELTGGTFSELEKRLSENFTPDRSDLIVNKSTASQSEMGLQKAQNYIDVAKRAINEKITTYTLAKNQSEVQKSVNLYNQLSVLDNSIVCLSVLLAEARAELEKRKISDPNDSKIDSNRNRLNIIEDRTVAIVREFSENVSKDVSQDLVGLIDNYKRDILEHLSALSEYPALKKWFWRAIWVVVAVGLVLSGAGIVALVADLSFKAALLAVLTFGAMKSTEALVIPAAVLIGAGGDLYTERWNNLRGKRAVKEIRHDLEELNKIKMRAVS